MLRVQPPFAWKLELPGRKRARVEFVDATWEVDAEMQAKEQTPPSAFHSPALSPSRRGAAEGGGAARGAVRVPVAEGGGGGGALETGDGGSGGGAEWQRDSWFGTGFCRLPG